MKLWITPRQLEILHLICTGKSYKEAAYDLGIATATVETHMQLAVKRNKCGHTTQLAVEAVRSGQLVMGASP